VAVMAAIKPPTLKNRTFSTGQIHTKFKTLHLMTKPTMEDNQNLKTAIKYLKKGYISKH
jgi:hypothetical protein